jgi:hypothetical protein
VNNPTFDLNTFNTNLEVMKLYVDSAKVYLQIATGALVFSLAFIEKLFVSGGSIRSDRVLTLSWASLLASIAFSMFYLYLAAKNVDLYSTKPGGLGNIPKSLIENCGHIYGLMLVFFYLGIVLLTWALFRRAK